MTFESHSNGHYFKLNGRCCGRQQLPSRPLLGRKFRPGRTGGGPAPDPARPAARAAASVDHRWHTDSCHGPVTVPVTGH